MRIVISIVLAIVLAFLVTAPTLGQDEGTKYFWGLNSGLMFSSFSDADAAVNVGGSFSWESSRWSQAFWEVDLSTSVFDGEVGFADFSVTTLGSYLGWRSGGDLYWKLKGGLLGERVSVGFADVNEFGFTAGAGLGWRTGKSLWEFEASVIEEDIFFFNLAYHFNR